jgi:tetratricopeptide (TPR) repeat protein
VERKGLSIDKRDYHSLQWRAYANLQRGIYTDSLEAIRIVGEAAKEIQSARLERIKTSMQATHMIETGRYEDLPLPQGEPDTSRYSSTANLVLAIGMGAAQAKNAAKTEQAAAIVGGLAAKSEDPYTRKTYSIMEHELRGLALMVKGETDSALAQLDEATKIEETLDPPSGPVFPLKPSHELYGEVLAQAGKHKEAFAEFQTSLERTPNRTASLIGLARSAVAVGDMETATEAYETLQRFLRDANPDVAFLAEVRGFHPSTEDR